MSDEELAQMPILVPESLRFACSDKYCGYKAIDEVMLAYHIDTLHPGKRSILYQDSRNVIVSKLSNTK